MKENSAKTVRLPEDDPTAFECILTWVYSKTIEISKPDSSSKTLQFVQAYALADKLCMESLSNSLVDHIMEWHKTVYSTPHLIAEAPESPIKEFLVAELAWELRRGQIWESQVAAKNLERFFRSGVPEVFEVMKVNGQLTTVENPVEPCEGPKCKYHKHVDTGKCKEAGSATE